MSLWRTYSPPNYASSQRQAAKIARPKGMGPISKRGGRAFGGDFRSVGNVKSINGLDCLRAMVGGYLRFGAKGRSLPLIS